VFFTILSFLSGINKIANAITAINVIKKYIVDNNKYPNNQNNNINNIHVIHPIPTQIQTQKKLSQKYLDIFDKISDQSLLESLFRMTIDFIIDLTVDIMVNLSYYILIILCLIILIMSKCFMIVLLILHDILISFYDLKIYKDYSVKKCYDNIIRSFINMGFSIIKIIYPIVTFKDKFYQIVRPGSITLTMIDWNNYLIFLRDNHNSKNIDQIDKLIHQNISQINLIIKLALNKSSNGLSYKLFHDKMKTILGEIIDYPHVICHNEKLRFMYQEYLIKFYVSRIFN
jgi:hypothetical protein